MTKQHFTLWLNKCPVLKKITQLAEKVSLNNEQYFEYLNGKDWRALDNY
jgi:hypothetical protein